MNTIDSDRLALLREQSDVLFWWGTLLNFNMPILQSLEKTTSRSRQYKDILRVVHSSIMNGGTANCPMEQSRIFLPLVPVLVRIGEESGLLSEGLLAASCFIDKVIEVSLIAKPDEFELPIAFYAFVLLINTGAPWLQSLQAMESLPIPHAKLFGDMARCVEEGKSLSAALKQVGGDTFVANDGGLLTDPCYMNLIEVGEESGTIDTALEQVANRLMRKALSINAF